MNPNTPNPDEEPTEDSPLLTHLTSQDSLLNTSELTTLLQTQHTLTSNISTIDTHLKNFDIVDFLDLHSFDFLTFEMYYEIMQGLYDSLIFFKEHNVTDYLSKATTLNHKYKNLLIKKIVDEMNLNTNCLLCEDVQRMFLFLTENEVHRISARYLKVRKKKLLMNSESYQKNYSFFLPQCIKQEIYTYLKMFKSQREEFLSDVKSLMLGSNASGILCCFIYSFLKSFFKGIDPLEVKHFLETIEVDCLVAGDAVSESDLNGVSVLLIVKSLNQMFNFEECGDIVFEL